MQKHVKILGWLYLAFGVMGLLSAVLFGGITLVASLFSGDAGAAMAGGLIGTIIGIVLTIVSLPSLLAGWGLLKNKNWARILTIVISVVNLPVVPFGTALGAYGLWVMLNDEVAHSFRHGRIAY